MLPLVWPLPRSLATTSGISFDFSSSPYLDVSVQAVPFLHLFDSMQDLWAFPTGVSPFGNPWINAHLQLPMAYRSLSRPSSAPSAKAFSLRSFLLDQSWFSQELLWQPCSARCILYTLCQNRKTFKLIFVHLNVFSIVAFFFPLFSFQCAFSFSGWDSVPLPTTPWPTAVRSFSPE